METESLEHRRKRLAMRSMRRGIKEMDLILSAYAEVRLAAMAPGEMDLYDALLSENDHDLYQWVTAQRPAPAPFAPLIEDIATVAGAR
jgi:antitoxin CptB